MPLNTKFVQLDLNNPEFQKSWVELEAEDAERVRSALKKILKLTWQDVYKDKGLRWEKVQSLPTPDGIDALYTFRLNKSARAVGYRDGNFLRVLLVSPDHDKAYGKK
jgi:hypothetical protein